MHKSHGVLLVAGILLGSLLSAGAEELELASLVRGQPDGYAYMPAVSGDSRWVSFTSYGTLVSQDRNNQYDIYVRQLGGTVVERISVASDGSEANGPSHRSALSSNGRFVVFDSYASNLVPGDSNGVPDVFLRDRLTGTTELVSVASDGSRGNYASNGEDVSADGRFVVFHSCATTLAPNDPGLAIDVYLRDRVAQTTTRIANYASDPALSSDGRFVAYRKGNRQLELLDLQTGGAELIGPMAYFPARPSISGDGRFVAYEGLPAGGAPMSVALFVYDRLARASRQITPTYDRSAWIAPTHFDSLLSLRPAISDDGRFVLSFLASELSAEHLGHRLYLHDLVKQSTQPLPIDNLWTTWPAPDFELSGDGSVLVFHDVIQNHLPQLAGYSSYAIGVFAWRTGTTGETGPGAGGSAPPAGSAVTLTAEPALLWPADSKLVPVKLAVAAPGASSVEIRIADEYGSYTQTLFGSEVSVPLEAWRQGGDKDGRLYTITAVVTDAAGRQSSATATVTVPHDRR